MRIGGNLETINEIQTRAQKVTHFMSHIVLPGAQIYLPKLVEVMELCDDLVVRDFAERMKTAMGSGTCILGFNRHIYRMKRPVE